MTVLSDLGASNAAIPTRTLTAVTGVYYLTDYYQSGDGTVNVHGAVGTIPNYYAAFNRIQDLIVAGTNKTAAISLPAGDIGFSATLNVYVTIQISGAAMGDYPARPGTRMYWPKNMTGIRCWDSGEVNTALSDPAYGPYPGPAGVTSAGGLIENVSIMCPDDTTTSGHGVHISSNFHLNRVNVQGWGGDGVRIFAYNPGQGAINAGTGQSDMWYISDAIIRSNKGDGLHVQGADTNAGCAIMILGGNNGGWDFNDQSWLGNTYIGCQSDGAGLGSYKSTSANTFVGCYNESKATSLGPTTYVDGGVLDFSFQTPSLSISGDGNGATAMVVAVDGNGSATKILPVTTGWDYTSATVTVFKQGDGSGLAVTANVVGGSVTSYTITNGGSGYIGRGSDPGRAASGNGGMLLTGPVIIPNNQPTTDRYLETHLSSTANTLFSASAYNTGNNDSEFFYALRWQETRGVWYLAVSGGPGFDDLTSIQWISRFSTTATMGRDAVVPTGSLHFPNGFFLGGGVGGDSTTYGRYVTSSDAAPTAGYHSSGEIYFNRAPSSGGFIGWVCTTAGTPGTWKTFGAISA